MKIWCGFKIQFLYKVVFQGKSVKDYFFELYALFTKKIVIVAGGEIRIGENNYGISKYNFGYW